jgi:hypothetical protein
MQETTRKQNDGGLQCNGGSHLVDLFPAQTTRNYYYYKQPDVSSQWEGSFSLPAGGLGIPANASPG